ncbi:MAG: prepilin-type cleavage/methylation domain-containing protein [Comamonadaceae bacterium]|nr:MAG: prepilin-type cleavage/methylation domain-containing protein [Comamonadaceae bacterium]
MTLVELLVAMALAGLVAVAAVSALVVGRRGFGTVDAASQVRDNARFAVDIIQRLTLQAGYRDIVFAASLHPVEAVEVTEGAEPGVGGFNNATPSPSDPARKPVARSPGLAGSSGPVGYGSDMLVLRYQSSSTASLAASSASAYGASDESMIDCAGNPASAPASRGDQIVSVLHVATGADGEPALMCTVASKALASAQPVVKGVENFQVLYGVDNVYPGTPTPPSTPRANLANRYLRADEMVVSGDAVATAANWRRVRSLRIGMVLRSSPGAAKVAGSQVLYPLGRTSSLAGTTGSGFSAPADPGTVFQVESDGRVRQVVTFTVHLRNEQDV